MQLYTEQTVGEMQCLSVSSFSDQWKLQLVFTLNFSDDDIPFFLKWKLLIMWKGNMTATNILCFWEFRRKIQWVCSWQFMKDEVITNFVFYIVHSGD